MPTIRQIINGARTRKIVTFNRAQDLESAPQRSATVISVLIRKPKKPNSANRKIVKAKLSNGRVVFAYVPGEGHNLQPHSRVLIHAGRRQDLVGMNLRVIRNAKGYDCKGVEGRKNGRSRYGAIKSAKKDV